MSPSRNSTERHPGWLSLGGAVVARGARAGVTTHDGLARAPCLFANVVPPSKPTRGSTGRRPGRSSLGAAHVGSSGHETPSTFWPVQRAPSWPRCSSHPRARGGWWCRGIHDGDLESRELGSSARNTMARDRYHEHRGRTFRLPVAGARHSRTVRGDGHRPRHGFRTRGISLVGCGGKVVGQGPCRRVVVRGWMSHRQGDHQAALRVSSFVPVASYTVSSYTVITHPVCPGASDPWHRDPSTPWCALLLRTGTRMSSAAAARLY